MIQGIFVLVNIALSCFWNSFELTRGLSETNWSLRPERPSYVEEKRAKSPSICEYEKRDNHRQELFVWKQEHKV